MHKVNEVSIAIVTAAIAKATFYVTFSRLLNPKSTVMAKVSPIKFPRP